MKILLDKIHPNPYQSRLLINDEELRELAESIAEHGLLQPIKVRPTNNGYELVYGHRRVSAMRLLGWTECDAVIEDVSDEESFLQSIAENLQRENLDFLEEANSYRLLSERGYTLKEISELINKPQGRISNRLSILRLPKEVQELVQHRQGQHTPTTELGGISPDSASRISSATRTTSEAIEIAQKAINDGLNSQEIRELTSILKEIDDHYQRLEFIKTYEKAGDREDNRGRQSISTHIHSKPEISFEDSFHRKWLWNLIRLRLENFDHFTIGYSSRTTQQFIQLLRVAKVDVLVDIRYVPISRFRPDYSMTNLIAHLSREGIQYIHIQALGIPPEFRRSLEEKVDLFTWYDDHVDIKKELHGIEPLLKNRRIAFMCVEIDPDSCHRHRISQYLENQGFYLLDL